MGNLLSIGIGGFIGAVLRYWISGFVQNLSRSISFPYGTLAVNILGCFMIGFLIHLVEYRSFFSPTARLLLLTGFLGALTTFSTFGLETINLFRDGEIIRGILNILLNNFFGLLAVLIGGTIPFLIWR